MTMPTIFAQLIRHRIAGLALAPLAAVCLACAPAMAQAQTDAAAPTDKLVQKEAAEKAREHLHKQREVERAEILNKRAVIEQERVADEKLCYQKFAVEGCLAEARRAAREKDAPLRARELEINDAERKEKAAAKLQAIEEKKAENAAVPMKSQQRDKNGSSHPKGSGAKPAVDEQAAQAQRQTEAQQRAGKQADYVRRHEQNRAQADQGRAEREAKAKADYDAKLKAAAEHKARALQQAKERGQTSAPLPAPAP